MWLSQDLPILFQPGSNTDIPTLKNDTILLGGCKYDVYTCLTILLIQQLGTDSICFWW